MTDPGLDVDEAVFDVVEQIPPGRVSTYGAIGRLIGIGPRRVARALSSGGGAVPWYRVVRADGTAAEPVRVEQLALLAAEGVPVRGGRSTWAPCTGRDSRIAGRCRAAPCGPIRRHHLQDPAVPVDHLVMNTMACRAVAAGRTQRGDGVPGRRGGLAAAPGGGLADDGGGPRDRVRAPGDRAHLT